MNGSVTLEADSGTAAAGRPLGAISTLVSLFLLLLVFFIVLFSIAQVHRQRVDEVVSSIDRAFGGIPSRFGLLPPPVLPGTDSDPSGTFVREASVLLTGFAPPEASALPSSGPTVLEIELPAERFFAANSPALTDAAGELAGPLAVLVGRRADTQPHYRLTLRIGPASKPSAEARKLALARASTLAATLFAKGAQTARLAIGYQPALTGQVRFEFAAIEPAGGTP